MEQQTELKVKNNKDNIKVAAIVCAFFPITGPLGIHNFLLKQYRMGLLHILVDAMICCGIFFVNRMCGNLSSSCHNLAWISDLLVKLGGGITVVWAMIEGVLILKDYTKKPSVQTNTTSANQVVDNTSSMGAVNSLSVPVSAPEPDPISEPEPAMLADNKFWAIVSLVTIIIPIIIIVGLAIASKQNSMIGAAAIPLGYFIVPCVIISLICGIKGLKTKLRKLSMVSLIILAVCVFLVMFVSRFLPFLGFL